MKSAPSARPFEVRHVQFARAALAAIAALMITFSPDHSADLGLAVFSGFAIATGFVFLLSTWLVYPAGQRWPSVFLGIVAVLAGMAGGIPQWRTVTLYFAIVIAWALVSGLVETIYGWRGIRPPREPKGLSHPTDAPRMVMPRAEARDALVIGILTIVLGAALLLVPAGFSLDYTIEEGNETFTLTGTTIAVGLFGGYAAIVAVYLAIAGFSPRAPETAPVTAEAPGDSTATEERGRA